MTTPIEEEHNRLFQVSRHATRFRLQQRHIHPQDPSSPFPEIGPTTAKATPWTPYLRELLCGIHDSNSPLSLLRGLESTILREIYRSVIDWREHIVQTPPARFVGRFRTMPSPEYETIEHRRDTIIHVENRLVFNRRNIKRLGGKSHKPEIAFSICGTVEFPEPADRNVNMMPFIMGDVLSLPEDLRPYYNNMVQKCPVKPEELGKVCYLTVCEGMVKEEETQRRGGLHIEAAGISPSSTGAFSSSWEHSWGSGMAFTNDEYNGGIYMASNLDHTCEIYDVLLNKSYRGIVDSHGGCEHLRCFFGKGTKLPANQLVWFTDRTPHEALRQEKTAYRQFFRLVTSDISMWYADHSTRNPKVEVPKSVRVIHGSKFDAKDGAIG